MSGIDELDEWCDKIYEDNFGEYFKGVRELHNRLSMENRTPIPDADLEMILIDLPLELVFALENVHRLKTHQEIMKYNAKRGIDQIADAEEKKLASTGMMAIAKAYENIIERADREISYCRELIMGAKKIWDARRNAENANPTSETTKKSKKLPEQQYIK